MKSLTLEQVREITLRYYGLLSGFPPETLSPGTHLLCTPERDRPLQGLGCRYGVYALVQPGLCAVSYSPRHRAFFEALGPLAPAELLDRVRAGFPLRHMKLLLFAGLRVTDLGSARVLFPADYPLYEDFFRAANPAVSLGDDPWLRDYFLERSAWGGFTGVEADGRLVSVCDAPDMPYLAGEIQHTGIVTLPAYRRRGFARQAAALAARHHLEHGLCPQWECRAENTASYRLALSVGYAPWADAYLLEEEA